MAGNKDFQQFTLTDEHRALVEAVRDLATAKIAPRAADLGPRIAAVQGVAEACDIEAVRAVFTDPRQAHNRWKLMFYALWWSIHVGGASPAEAAEAIGAR